MVHRDLQVAPVWVGRQLQLRPCLSISLAPKMPQALVSSWCRTGPSPSALPVSTQHSLGASTFSVSSPALSPTCGEAQHKELVPGSLQPCYGGCKEHCLIIRVCCYYQYFLGSACHEACSSDPTKTGGSKALGQTCPLACKRDSC